MPDRDEVINKLVQDICEVFSDGLQIHDIIRVTEMALEFSYEEVVDEPRLFCIDVINEVIDRTDTPWMPDNLTDPIMKKFVPALVEWVFGLVEKARAAQKISKPT